MGLATRRSRARAISTAAAQSSAHATKEVVTPIGVPGNCASNCASQYCLAVIPGRRAQASLSYQWYSIA